MANGFLMVSQNVGPLFFNKTRKASVVLAGAFTIIRPSENAGYVA